MEPKACIFNIQRFSIHDGPGIRTTIFFKGCPLRCYWCSNPESWNGKPELMWDNIEKENITVGEYKTVHQLVNEVRKDIDFYEESGGGVTLSGGEVLFQADFAMDLLQELEKEKIHRALETCGYGSKDAFNRLIMQANLLYFDLKHYNHKKHQKGTGVSLEVILENLELAVKSHPHLVVRIPIIPSYNDSTFDALAFAKLLDKKSVQHVELLPFHQFGESKYKYLNKEYTLEGISQLHEENLQSFKEVLLSHGLEIQQ